MDDLIGANVTLQHNGQKVKYNIMKRGIGPDRNPIGKYNHNPILESKKYEVELPDGVVGQYYHNILLGDLLSQFDEERRVFVLIK